MTLPKRVLDRMRRQGQVERGSRLAVAVSGGVDSVVLLDILCSVQRALGVELVVAHLDHGLRGACSAEDATFVRALAASRGLACYCGRMNGLDGRGVEDAARQARLSFLRGVPAARVAVGHHLDDLAETVLLRLLRSSSVEALGAMLLEEASFVRPMLELGREEILAWAQRRGLAWREDASNRDPAHERNRLRHQVLPLLDQVHGGVRGRLAALAEAAADAERAERAEGSWRAFREQDAIVREQLNGMPRARRVRALRLHAQARMGGDAGIPRSQLLEVDELAKRGRPGAWVPLPWGWRYAVSGQALVCLPRPPAPVLLRLTGVRSWGIHQVATRRLTSSEEPVLLRAPLPGERFGGQPLREWLRRRGVPAALRPYHPVVARDDRVVWVPGGHPLEGSVVSGGLAIDVTASIPSIYRPGRPWTATL